MTYKLWTKYEVTVNHLNQSEQSEIIIVNSQAFQQFLFYVFL